MQSRSIIFLYAAYLSLPNPSPRPADLKEEWMWHSTNPVSPRNVALNFGPLRYGIEYSE